MRRKPARFERIHHLERRRRLRGQHRDGCAALPGFETPRPICGPGRSWRWSSRRCARSGVAEELIHIERFERRRTRRRPPRQRLRISRPKAHEQIVVHLRARRTAFPYRAGQTILDAARQRGSSRRSRAEAFCGSVRGEARARHAWRSTAATIVHQGGPRAGWILDVSRPRNLARLRDQLGHRRSDRPAGPRLSLRRARSRRQPAPDRVLDAARASPRCSSMCACSSISRLRSARVARVELGHEQARVGARGGCRERARAARGSCDGWPPSRRARAARGSPRRAGLRRASISSRIASRIIACTVTVACRYAGCTAGATSVRSARRTRLSACAASGFIGAARAARAPRDPASCPSSSLDMQSTGSLVGAVVWYSRPPETQIAWPFTHENSSHQSERARLGRAGRSPPPRCGSPRPSAAGCPRGSSRDHYQTRVEAPREVFERVAEVRHLPVEDARGSRRPCRTGSCPCGSRRGRRETLRRRAAAGSGAASGSPREITG